MIELKELLFKQCYEARKNYTKLSNGFWNGYEYEYNKAEERKAFGEFYSLFNLIESADLTDEYLIWKFCHSIKD